MDSWEELVNRTRGEGLPRVLTLSEVEGKEVDWLWYPYVPRGGLVILEGDPGKGKSYLTAALAAGVSTGEGLPGWGPRKDPQDALMLFLEDDAAHTLAPRLRQQGADLNRIHGMDYHLDLSDTQARGSLKRIIESYKPALVTIDPIMHYLGMVDSFRDSQVRSVLGPLVDMAREHRFALVAVRHLTKAATTSPLYRGQGSIAFTALARSVLMVGWDGKRDTRAMVHIKSNLARYGRSQGYTIDNGFRWTGPTETQGEDLT